MEDISELPRRIVQNLIHAEIESNSEFRERARLETQYGIGNVWDTDEVTRSFEVVSFLAPYCAAIRKSDGVKGTLQFQHHPRFYFNFRER